MNGSEIKKKIDEDNEKLAELATPSFFTLNKQVYELLQEVNYLQGLCVHEFKDGVCIFCGKEEENKEE